MGYHILLQGISLTQGLSQCFLRLLCRQADSLPLSTWEGPVLRYRCSKKVKMCSPSSGLMVETTELLPPSEVWAKLALGRFGHSVIGRVIS